MPESPKKPITRIKSSNHYPTKQELEQDMSTPLSPEELGRIVMGCQTVVVGNGEDSGEK